MKEKMTDNYKNARQNSLIGNKQKDVIVVYPTSMIKKDNSSKTSNLQSTIRKPSKKCGGCSRNKKGNG